MQTRMIIFILLLLWNAALNADQVGAKDYPLIHAVLVWLKEPGNTEHRRAIIMASGSFKAIPGVVDVKAGEVVTSERDIVDDSFDVGIYLYFNTLADMRSYLIHPAHKSAVEDILLPLVDKIVVYDFYDRIQ